MGQNKENKILMIVAFFDFRDEEYKIPRGIFEKEGFSINVASSSKGEAKGKFGERVKVDFSLEEVDVEDYKAIVFVGGPGTVEYFENPLTLDLAKRAFKKEKVVAAICIAPSILANAGILKDKKATSFSSEKENLEEKGAIYTNRNVERDGKIITALGPQAAFDFAQEILKTLKEE